MLLVLICLQRIQRKNIVESLNPAEKDSRHDHFAFSVALFPGRASWRGCTFLPRDSGWYFGRTCSTDLLEELLLPCLPAMAQTCFASWTSSSSFHVARTTLQSMAKWWKAIVLIWSLPWRVALRMNYVTCGWPVLLETWARTSRTSLSPIWLLNWRERKAYVFWSDSILVGGYWGGPEHVFEPCSQSCMQAAPMCTALLTTIHDGFLFMITRVPGTRSGIAKPWPMLGLGGLKGRTPTAWRSRLMRNPPSATVWPRGMLLAAQCKHGGLFPALFLIVPF